MTSKRFGVQLSWYDLGREPYSCDIGRKEKQALQNLFKIGLEKAKENIESGESNVNLLKKIHSAKFEVRERDISCSLILTKEEIEELDNEIRDFSFEDMEICRDEEGEIIVDGEKELFAHWFVEEL